MDELLAAGVYVVQVYNLIISSPLVSSYLRATRFRPVVVVYVARRTSICIMRARSLAYVRIYYMRRVTRCTRERERRVGVSEKQADISHR